MVGRRVGTESDSGEDRRSFLTSTTTIAMGAGLAAGYGTLFAMAGRFLYPVESGNGAWQFVGEVDALRLRSTFEYTAPNGQPVVIAYRDDVDEPFIALSSVCPHLGCQVHWDTVRGEFICPCHNGAFDAGGTATLGPPASAGQSLKRFPLRISDGLLFIEVPTESLADSSSPMHPESDQRTATTATHETPRKRNA